jgi:hypothetical protein
VINIASIYGAWSDYVRDQYPGGSKIPSVPGAPASTVLGAPASVLNATPGGPSSVPLPTTRRTGTTKQGTFQSKQPW